MAADFSNKQAQNKIAQDKAILSQEQTNRLNNLIAQDRLDVAEAMNIDSKYGTNYVQQINNKKATSIGDQSLDILTDAKSFLKPGGFIKQSAKAA